MEKLEHYNWYVYNCEDSAEIPLSYEEWEKEIYPDLLKFYGEEELI